MTRTRSSCREWGGILAGGTNGPRSRTINVEGRAHGCLCESPAKATIRCVEARDFEEEYRSKTDEELLRLALDPAQLIPEADAALNGELARRRINNLERLKAFREEEEQHKEEQIRNPGRLFVVPSLWHRS